MDFIFNYVNFPKWRQNKGKAITRRILTMCPIHSLYIILNDKVQVLTRWMSDLVLFAQVMQLYKPEKMTYAALSLWAFSNVYSRSSRIEDSCLICFSGSHRTKAHRERTCHLHLQSQVLISSPPQMSSPFQNELTVQPDGNKGREGIFTSVKYNSEVYFLNVSHKHCSHLS